MPFGLLSGYHHSEISRLMNVAFSILNSCVEKEKSLNIFIFSTKSIRGQFKNVIVFSLSYGVVFIFFHNLEMFACVNASPVWKFLI